MKDRTLSLRNASIQIVYYHSSQVAINGAQYWNTVQGVEKIIGSTSIFVLF